MRQRLVVVGSLVVGGLCWMQAGPALLPESGLGGVTLLNAPAWLVGGAVVALLAGAVAVGLAVLCGAMGNPLAAAFVFGAALCFLARRGGTTFGFLVEATPGRYVALLVEAGVWFAMLAGTLWLTSIARLPLRRRLPWLATEARRDRSLLRGWGDPASPLGVLVTAGVGGLLAHLMIRTWDAGQIVGALLFSFTIGSLVAQMVATKASPGALVLSPLVVAAVGYVQAFMLYGSNEELLAAAFRGEASGLAWTLPVHYASAGVAGCALGAGLGQALLLGERAKDRRGDAAGDAAAA